MTTLSGKKPEYGNWVSRKFLYGPGAATVLFLVLAVVVRLALAPALVCLLVTFYFLYARYRFSAGGNIQSRIQDLVLSNLDWDGQGKALDIGCGNAPLTIKLAKKYGAATVTGIDYWGKMWEYSKDACEKNAAAEGVADRLSFQKASASALPFPDGFFDAAVSNLTFHEVSDTKDKRQVVREALRVVRKGGKFAFQDLFLVKSAYGDLDDLQATIKGWEVSKVEFVKTCDAPFIPGPLKLPFMIGTIGILHGEK